MMPLPGRWLSSALIRHNGKMILIDCGEGTQIPVKICGWGFNTRDGRLFTHYPADHIAGLPGLLLTMNNSGREEPLTLIGPPGIKRVVEGLLVVCPQFLFDVMVGEISVKNEDRVLVNELVVNSIPADHNMPCLSFGIELSRKGKFDVERAKRLDIPVTYWKVLQSGESVEYGGKAYEPDMVLGELRRGIKICYCTDTRPVPGIAGFVNGADLFICEGMYGCPDDFDSAEKKKHMTYAEAAEIAKNGNVKELWLTHFSPMLVNPNEYLSVASNIFPNSVAGKDLMKKTLGFVD
jgi:ribonuclease Z